MAATELKEEANATAPTTQTCGCASTPSNAAASQDARYKHTPRSQDLQKDLNKRLNRIIGQLNGVKQMIDDNRYCGDVLVQLAAAQSALRSVSSLVLDNHMRTCVVEKIQNGDTEVIDELSKLIKKFS